MNRRRPIIWMIAGGYLVYLGVNMFRNVSEEQPTNFMLLYAAAAFFAVVGLTLVVAGLRTMLKKPKEDKDADGVAKEAISESNIESPSSKKGNMEPIPKDSEPKRAKTMRERAMIGNVISDETREVHKDSPLVDSGQILSDTETFPSISPNPSLQNTDVDIASEDIIAATEEIIATQESEKAIATINQGEHN